MYHHINQSMVATYLPSFSKPKLRNVSKLVSCCCWTREYRGMFQKKHMGSAVPWALNETSLGQGRPSHKVLARASLTTPRDGPPSKPGPRVSRRCGPSFRGALRPNELRDMGMNQPPFPFQPPTGAFSRVGGSCTVWQ